MAKKLTTIIIVALLVFSLGTTVFAQEGTEEVFPCEGDQVSGTVVDYDPDTYTVTIDTGDGLCTVTLNEGDQDYGHPITTLLGNYFNSMNVDDFNFEEALGSTEVCVALDEGDQYVLFTPEEGEDCPLLATVTVDNGDDTFQVVLVQKTGTLDPEGESVEVDSEVCVEYDEATETYMLLPLVEGECEGEWATVTGDNEDGTYQIVTEAEGEGTLGGVDEETANGLSDSLGSLMVEWGLNEDGSLEDAGDKVGELHESGVGFGVIVKLFGIASESQEACNEAGETEGEPVAEGDEPASEEPCGVTFDELAQMLEEGTPPGKLFKMFGKPALKGVGHVRKEMKNQDAAATSEEGSVEEGSVEGSFDEGPSQKDKSNKGVCKAREKGGNAKAKGKGDVVCSSGD